MKKPNMFAVNVTTIWMAVFALAAWPACGQNTPVATEEKASAPMIEHFKVETGSVWERKQQRWAEVGPATVGNAVKALRDIYPEVTLAVDPHVAAVPVTDLVVHAKDAAIDLSALRTACGNKFDIDHDGTKTAFYSLEANNLTFGHDPSMPEDRAIECFNLTGYLTQVTTPTPEEMASGQDKRTMKTDKAVAELQDILRDAIQSFDPALPQPHCKFYTDAQLLIVIGSQRAIDVAAKVICALPGEQGRAAGGWPPPVFVVKPPAAAPQPESKPGKQPNGP
jgi:hypothetical protein